MANVPTTDAVARLVEGVQGCLGAVFLTYTFDAAFFEEEILAALLPIQEDPAEATRRFLEEGRRKLVETPVVVIADPGMLRGGQRLPYDLLRADPGRTFHPKLALLLHPGGARLVVGSGNLTPGGYGGNAELMAALNLDFSQDAGLIRQVLELVRRCGARGEAWERLLAELKPRLGDGPPTEEAPRLLHSVGEQPLLDAFLACIPTGATIEQIGVLAPFHQEDGALPDAAVLDRLLDAAEGRRARSLIFDVGVSWEGNPVAPGRQTPGPFHEHTGELWGWLEGAAGKETMTWFVLGQHDTRSYAIDDGRTQGWRSTRELNAAWQAGHTWPIGTVEAFAPAGLVARASGRASLRLWLHPEIHRRDGRTWRQPLHGKLIAIATREGKVKRTWLLVGSPNASAAALLRRDANVECALVWVVDGHHTLGTLCERLVYVPTAQVRLLERTFTPPAASPGRWVEDAVYDAERWMLLVRWRAGAPRLQLRYPLPVTRLLLDEAPGSESLFQEFSLDPACCELEICDPALDARARVPIRVENVAQLPVEGLTRELDLEELLQLHSGRITPEGVTARRAARGSTSDGSAGLAAVFGDALTPREVFRALLSIGRELERAPSLSAFQAQVLGPWGVRRLAERLVEAPRRGELMHMEAWLYGHELARILRRLSFDGDPTAENRAALRDALVGWLRGALPEPAPDTPGLAQLRHFYLGDTP